MSHFSSYFKANLMVCRQNQWWAKIKLTKQNKTVKNAIHICKRSLETSTMCANLLHSCLTLCNLWTVAYLAPLSLGFSRPEYWSGLPCPPPGDLPDPGIEPESPAFLHCRQILYHWVTRRSKSVYQPTISCSSLASHPQHLSFFMHFWVYMS